MTGGTADAATLKPGDRVLITIERTVNEDGGVFLFGANYLSKKLRGNSGVVVSPVPAPYTEPRDGDEVEVTRTVRGQVRVEAKHSWVEFSEEPNLTHSELGLAVREGRVRLVKAAAPTYERYGLYYEPKLPHLLYRYVPDADQPDVPWVIFDTAWTDAQKMSPAYRIHRNNVPSDLVPCDVVPREAAS